MTSTIHSFFSSGGGGKYAKFEKIGDQIKGKVVAVHPPEQATDPQGKVKTDKHGTPLMLVRLELQTDLRNPDIEFDDGIRTLYVQSYMTDAVIQALRKAGASEPEIGGELDVVLTELVPNPPPLNASKMFQASYVRPANAFFAGATTPAGAAGNGLAKPANFDQKVWDDMPESARAAVLALTDAPPF